MNRIVKLAAVGLAVVALPAAASAATIDFATYAKNNEHAVANGGSESVGGFNITFYSTKNGQDAWAYFDHSAVTAGDTAGLGVCGVLRLGPGDTVNNGDAYSGGTNECSPSSDDNLTAGESLILEFEFAVALSDLVFRNHDHSEDAALNDKLDIGVDGATPVEMTFGAASGMTFIGTSFYFGYDGEDANQFYISSATANGVPAPAALGLLGFGLMGLGGLAKRRRG